jgi:hypothetical protein
MATYYWVGGSGTWSGTGNTQFAITSGGVATLLNPNSTDTVIFDANSGTAATVTVTSTAVSLATTINKSDINLSLSGNVTLCANSLSGVLTLTTGTLTLNGFTLSCGIFSSNNTNTRTIAFGSTGQITITFVSSGTAWDMRDLSNFTTSGNRQVLLTTAGAIGTTVFHRGTGASEARAVSFKFTAASGVLTFANTNITLNLDFSTYASTTALANSTYTIYGNLTLAATNVFTAGANAWTFAATSGTQNIITNGVTLNNPLIFNGIGGTFAFQDALTQGSTRAFTITNGTVQLKNGVTSTVGVFATSGTNQKFLQSTLAGTQATLSQASGTVNASYLTIKDINATGGATWNALWSNSNVDAGNNTGWVFGNQPIINAVEYTYKIRSFTQPRRF